MKSRTKKKHLTIDFSLDIDFNPMVDRRYSHLSQYQYAPYIYIIKQFDTLTIYRAWRNR